MIRDIEETITVSQACDLLKMFQYKEIIRMLDVNLCDLNNYVRKHKLVPADLKAVFRKEWIALNMKGCDGDLAIMLSCGRGVIVKLKRELL